MLRALGLMVFVLGSLSAALHAQPAQHPDDHEEDRRALTYRLFLAAVGDDDDNFDPSLMSARLTDFAFARACMQTLQKAAVENAAALLPLHPIGPDENDPDTLRNITLQYNNDDIRRYAKTVESTLPPPDAAERAGPGIYHFRTDIAAMPNWGLGQPSGPSSEPLRFDLAFRDMIDTQCRERAPVS